MKTIKKLVKKIKNRTKEEIKSEIDYNNKVSHIKEVVRVAFPIIEKVDSIYDAQTVVNALSGFISAHIEKKIGEIKLNDITIDLSSEEESKIKSSIVELIELFKDESAKEISQTMERLGKVLSEFSANKFMKQPMSNITINDIVSE